MYKQLTTAARETIEALLQEHYTQKDIAEKLRLILGLSAEKSKEDQP